MYFMQKLEENSTNILNVSELSDGMRASKYAFLLKAVRGVDVNQDPYITFFLRTGDKCNLTARKFKVALSSELDTSLLLVQRKVVSLEFMAQIYRGNFSLIVENIRLAGETQIDKSMFFDEYISREQAFSELCLLSEEVKSKSLTPLLKDLSLFSILYGRTGGLLQILRGAAHILNLTEKEFRQEVLHCFFSIIDPYIRHLRWQDQLNITPKSEKLNLVNSRLINDDRLNFIAQDALTALIGLCPPEHLYAHLIQDSINSVASNLLLIENLKAAPRNIVVNHGERSLLLN